VSTETYKFCVISFLSGTRGAFLGYQLCKQYPNLFSSKPVIDNGPRFYDNHDTWHVCFSPHFDQEIFNVHPRLKLENLFDTPATQLLSRTKYNVILTHLYVQDDLKKLYDALAGHVVNTIQIVFDDNDKQSIVDRVASIFPNFRIKIPNMSEFKQSFLAQLGTVCNYRNPTAISVNFSDIKDYKNPPDLTDILEHFKL
jgi:hypothetical protein